MEKQRPGWPLGRDSSSVRTSLSSHFSITRWKLAFTKTGFDGFLCAWQGSPGRRRFAGSRFRRNGTDRQIRTGFDREEGASGGGWRGLARWARTRGAARHAAWCAEWAGGCEMWRDMTGRAAAGGATGVDEEAAGRTGPPPICSPRVALATTGWPDRTERIPAHRDAGESGPGPGAALNSRTNEPAAGEPHCTARRGMAFFRVGWASGAATTLSDRRLRSSRAPPCRAAAAQGDPAAFAPRGVTRWAGRTACLSCDNCLHG